MNRRSFLTGFGALIGGIAMDKAIPLGRVWSFPKEIKCLNMLKAAPVLAHPFITGYGLRPGDVIEIFCSNFSFKRATATVIATMGTQVFIDKEVQQSVPGDIVSVKRTAPIGHIVAPLPAILPNFLNLGDQLSAQNPSAR